MGSTTASIPPPGCWRSWPRATSRPPRSSRPCPPAWPRPRSRWRRRTTTRTPSSSGSKPAPSWRARGCRPSTACARTGATAGAWCAPPTPPRCWCCDSTPTTRLRWSASRVCSASSCTGSTRSSGCRSDRRPARSSPTRASADARWRRQPAWRMVGPSSIAQGRAMRILFALLAAILLVAPASAAPPRLMLATGYHDGIEAAEYFVSEKLDGVRGHWDGRALYTRAGNPIDAPQWFTAGWPAVPMDGELWLGRGRFEEASGIARTAGGGHPGWREMRFMVFDLPAHQGPFEQRVAAMRTMLAAANVAWLRPVEQHRVSGREDLDARMRAVVAAGGEGLMLHHRDARYRAGRSDRLLKLKPFDDAEARVVGHTPGRGKYTGMAGALVVERPDGLQFRIGSGLTDALRAQPPAVGTWVTYRFNGLTGNGVPRFPRFLRVRHELPPPDPE